MNILNKLYEQIGSFPNIGSVVVQTDSESLLIKDLFFEAGRKIVSDRDVFTLDYELTRHMSQTKGLRVLSDQLYPFLFEAGSRRESVQSALNFIKNFPDPFVENDLADVVLEFLEQEESAVNLLKTFKESLNIASESQSFAAVPRGFANLYLNELEFDDNTFFLSSLLRSLPLGFADQFHSKSIEVSEATLEWRDQIELFELYKEDDSFNFLDFEHQSEEVRAVLKALKSCKDSSKIQVLYPKNKGYEKLFYLYQREFFEKTVFSLHMKETETLGRALQKINAEIKPLQTFYDHNGSVNKNKVILTEVNVALYSLPDLVRDFFENDFSELDLNIISDLMVQLGQSRRLPLTDWKRILEQEALKINKKHEKLQSRLHINDYEFVSKEEPDEVWVLGWSDALFKKTGDRIFSNSIMSKMEINLGLFLPSLSKSEARALFQNPIMQNKNIRKNICFSAQSFMGGSNKPGVFKILFEEQFKAEKIKVDRSHITSNLEERKSRKAPLKIKNLSASSLQRYEECPYKFYLEKVIGFEVEDDEDYFLSPKQEGSLMHKILEDLKDDNFSKNKFEDKLRNLVLTEDPDFNTFREAAVQDLSERMWHILQEEKKHLQESGIVESLAEKFFRFDVNLSDRSFPPKDGDFSIRGLVDRIDIGKNKEALIYDYKRGDSGTHSLSLYKGTKLAPQLFLYCLAADKGLLGDFNSFVGFQYINLSLYKRQKGFVVKKKAEQISKEIPARSAVDEEKYEEKMELFLEKFWSVLESIKEEKFEETPNPAYSGQCASCHWVGVCKKSETFI